MPSSAFVPEDERPQAKGHRPTNSTVAREVAAKQKEAQETERKAMNTGSIDAQDDLSRQDMVRGLRIFKESVQKDLDVLEKVDSLSDFLYMRLTLERLSSILLASQAIGHRHSTERWQERFRCRR